MKTGIELIAKEREEQLTKHGRSVESDVHGNEFSQLTEAASFLLHVSARMKDAEITAFCPEGWSVEAWRKMCAKPYLERCIIAGALMAAEIDRLNYIEARKNGVIITGDRHTLFDTVAMPMVKYLREMGIAKYTIAADRSGAILCIGDNPLIEREYEQCENCEELQPSDDMHVDCEGCPICPECYEALKNDPEFMAPEGE